jgi:hypothetical protein
VAKPHVHLQAIKDHTFSLPRSSSSELENPSHLPCETHSTCEPLCVTTINCCSPVTILPRLHPPLIASSVYLRCTILYRRRPTFRIQRGEERSPSHFNRAKNPVGIVELPDPTAWVRQLRCKNIHVLKSICADLL